MGVRSARLILKESSLSIISSFLLTLYSFLLTLSSFLLTLSSFLLTHSSFLLSLSSSSYLSTYASPSLVLLPVKRPRLPTPPSKPPEQTGSSQRILQFDQQTLRLIPYRCVIQLVQASDRCGDGVLQQRGRVGFEHARSELALVKVRCIARFRGASNTGKWGAVGQFHFSVFVRVALNYAAVCSGREKRIAISPLYAKLTWRRYTTSVYSVRGRWSTVYGWGRPFHKGLLQFLLLSEI